MIKPKAKPKRSVTQALDNAAATIAANISQAQTADGWDQERIAALREHNGKVGAIPVGIIKVNDNVRQTVDTESSRFQELLASIRKHGVLQNPIVTVVTNEHGVHSILLVAGQRRLLAARLLGLDTIQCMVRIFDSKSTQLTASLGENLNREDLHPLDIASGYASLKSQGYCLEELEKLFGTGKKSLSRFIKAASWPAEVQALVRQHPEQFTTRKILALASRRLEPDEVVEAVKATIEDKGRKQTGQQDEQDAEAVPKPPMRHSLDRLMAYCQHRGLPKRDRELLVRALTELGVLRRIQFESPPKDAAKT